MFNNKTHIRSGSITLPVDWGYIYNGYFAAHALAAPTGWHVPTLAELGVLALSYNGIQLKEAGTTHWIYDANNGNNLSGFTAIGGGIRVVGYPLYDGFYELNNATANYRSSDGYYLTMRYNSSLVSSVSTVDKTGTCIRMLKNDSILADMVDADGNIYPAVQIGSQVWTKVDFRCTKYNDGSPIALVQSQAAWDALITSAYCIPPWTT